MTSPELDLRATPDPRFPGLLAGAICTLIALTLFLPMFSGQFLAGDDQLIAGYAFRHFGAEYFRQYHHIPQWNPYIFGGIPFFAVVGQGDIFYPTAWLRWIVSTDVGMTLGFFVHIVIAGWAMFGLLRGFRLSWGASLVGGVAYELTGMVVSQMSPGHDGKLFVAALAPLALLMLLRAIRDRKLGSYGGFAIVAGLAILTPQVQTAYYLLVAAGIFTLWLCFGDPERPRDRPAWQPLALATLAALLGVGISMIEVLPILTHVGMTPRAEGGDSYGWAYATAFALPIEELMTAIYPQFNGVNDTYWGQNFFKNHCEYVGALVLILAWFGIAPSRRKKAFTVLATIGGLFLLVALGGHTPFYRLWYTVMPMMNKVRAAGVAFYLVALVLCILAGFGAEELLAGRVKTRTVLTSLAIVGVLAILGAGGVLQGITESLARSIGAGLPDPNAASAMVSRAIQNEAALRMEESGCSWWRCSAAEPSSPSASGASRRSPRPCSWHWWSGSITGRSCTTSPAGIRPQARHTPTTP